LLSADERGELHDFHGGRPGRRFEIGKIFRFFGDGFVVRDKISRSTPRASSTRRESPGETRTESTSRGVACRGPPSRNRVESNFDGDERLVESGSNCGITTFYTTRVIWGRAAGKNSEGAIELFDEHNASSWNRSLGLEKVLGRVCEAVRGSRRRRHRQK
jgi:hypothetical protein